MFEVDSVSPKTTSTARATIQVGAFSFAVTLPMAERELVKEISDLYARYPQFGPEALPDFTISVQYPNLWRRFVKRRIQLFLDGQVRYRDMPPDLGVPLIESAINLWMGTYVNRFLLIHSGVVERKGHAILLPGASGSGKSTLSAVLSSRDWRLLSDEIAMVRLTDGLILPHPRPISLKNTSIEILSELAPDAHFTRRYEGTVKGTVAFLRVPRDAIERAMEPAKPAFVIFPKFNPNGGTELTRLDKARAFMALVENTPGYSTLLETGFESLAALVEVCDHYRLSYNSVDDAVSLIDSLQPAGRDRQP